MNLQKNLLLLTGLLTITGVTLYAAAEPNSAWSGEPLLSKPYLPPLSLPAVVIPSVTAISDNQGQLVSLHSKYLSASLRIDNDKHIQLTGIKTDTGQDLLSSSSYCFDLLGGDQFSRSGKNFTVINWHSWLHTDYAEAQFILDSGEEGSQIIWYLRVYRDKPYLEQRFELPEFWRINDRVVSQHLAIVDTLRPVMPSNILKQGFVGGMSTMPHRSPFEFVSQSEHVVYDPDKSIGLAVFAAGTGGEELMTQGKVELKDHATAQLGNYDSPARFLLFPFSGPVERGFWNLRKFISSDYSCQDDKYSVYTWNQFWLWQGKCMDWCFQELTSQRLMDILPHLNAMGVESLHIDAGWEIGMVKFDRNENPDWQFDPARFPQGFAPIRNFLRQHGMSYSTHMNCGAVNRPDVLLRIIHETDLDKLFIDQNVDETTLASIRQVRKIYPDFEVLCHSMCDRRRAVSYWKWGNLHWLNDFDQVYFGEGTWRTYLADLPKNITAARFIDLFTRIASYQAVWVWPYKTIIPPHQGFVLGGQKSPTSPPLDPNNAWYVNDASSLILTTIAARYVYGWGEDPRLVRPDTLKFFLDWTAFWKVFKPYLQEYQHVLSPPDGIHPDGASHIVNGQGFMVLFNLSPDKPCTIDIKDLLWSPEVAFELENQQTIALSNWTRPLAPEPIAAVELLQPSGRISIEPKGYFVLGVNVNIGKMLHDIKSQRDRMN